VSFQIAPGTSSSGSHTSSLAHHDGIVEINDVGGYGQGILLFDGELEIEDMEDDDFNFFGIIIQEGPGAEGMEFEEDGVNIYGSIIAGGDIDVEDGARIRYSQCAVDRALNGHGLGTPGSSHMSDRVWRQKLY
jgi:hypothetical protein